MRTYSVAQRVAVVVLLVELLAAVVVTGFAFFYERHAQFRSFDVGLRGRADTVMGGVEDADSRDLDVMLDTKDLKLPDDDVYAVREEGGKELGRKEGWTPEPMAWTGPEGSFSLRVDGQEYRGLRMRGVRVVDPMEANIRHPITVLYASPTRRVWGAVLGAVEVFALANGLLIAVTALAVPWLVRRSLDPLRALAEEAGGVSALDWRFAPRESVRAVRELGPLVGAMEAVIGRLERSFTQQRQFTGDAAHELKTAVAVVKSSIQLLEMRARTAAEYKEGLRRCYADCLRMEDLAQKMLLLARVEETAVPQAGANGTLLRAAVMAIFAELEPLAALHEVRLIAEQRGEAAVAVEPETMRSLLVNLLTNAVQHSKAGDCVRVSVARAEGRVSLEIEDRGDGIGLEAVPLVFNRFYRADPSRSRKTGGTGLGLAICKAIVERAGGEIGIESSVGVGTTVRVRLPEADEPAGLPQSS